MLYAAADAWQAQQLEAAFQFGSTASCVASQSRAVQQLFDWGKAWQRLHDAWLRRDFAVLFDACCALLVPGRFQDFLCCDPTEVNQVRDTHTCFPLSYHMRMCALCVRRLCFVLQMCHRQRMHPRLLLCQRTCTLAVRAGSQQCRSVLCSPDLMRQLLFCPLVDQVHPHLQMYGTLRLPVALRSRCKHMCVLVFNKAPCQSSLSTYVSCKHAWIQFSRVNRCRMVLMLHA